MTIIATPATAIAAALGIHADTRLRIEVTRTGWDNARCEETGLPGAVLVQWSVYDGDEGAYTVTDRTLSGIVAGDYINALMLSDQVDRFETVWVKVARPYLRFVYPNLADIADAVDMPAPVAA